MTSQSHRDGGRYRYLQRLASEHLRKPKPPTLHNRTWNLVHNPIFSRRTPCLPPTILSLLLCLLTAVQATSALSFDNPNIPAQAYCSTVLLSWSGGVPPYDLQIINVNPPGEQLEDFPGLTGTSMEWLAGGKVQQKNVIAKIIDSTGASAQTQQIPVGPGSPNECIQQQKVTPTSTSSTPPPTTTNGVSPVRPSTTPSPTPVPTTTSTSQTTTKGSSSATASAAPSSSSPSPSSPSSAPGSTSISSASSTSASATTNSQSQQPSSPTSPPPPTQSPPTASSSSGVPTLLSSSSSIPPSPQPIGSSKSRSHSLSPGAKAAIAIAIIVFVSGLGAFIFWLRRRALRRRKLVRSSGERADLNQESRPLLSELESPGRAVVAQRAWAGSSPPWASGQGGGGTFNPDDDSDDNVLVIQRHPPRSTDAQASGWQSDFTPATATTVTTRTRTSAGRPSLLSTTTTTRVPLPEDRYADSPIDPLLVRRGSTRPSSHVLPSTNATTSDLDAFDAMLEAEAASRTRAGRLTGTEIDGAVDSASEREEWDALSASDTRTVRTLPPPYQHHSV